MKNYEILYSKPDIVMMAAGSGGGILFLVVGILGFIKNFQQSSDIASRRSIEHRSPTQTDQTEAGNTLPKATHREMVCGAEAWACLQARIVGDVPAPPQIVWNNEDPFFPGMSLQETSMLVFIPKEIIVNGEQQPRPLTLNTLQHMIQHIQHRDHFYGGSVQSEFGNIPIQSGWVLMTREAIPDSTSKRATTIKAMLKEKGYRIPKAVEAVVCVLMEHITSERPLHESRDPLTFIPSGTCCKEQTKNTCSVMVTSFGPIGLLVTECMHSDISVCGAIAVRSLKAVA